ncbi:MAG: hypothetical protein HC828_09420 [Blastochloris sp.]|nr:hypothetical protein [Blastochloris sp.]
MAFAGLNPGIREKIGLVFKKAVEVYLTEKFDTWSVSASELTQAEVDKLREQLKWRIAEFSVKLQEARGTFTSDDKLILREQHDIAINITTGIFVGGTGVSGVIFGVLRRLTTLLLVLSISTLTVFGWAILIVLLLAEIGFIANKPIDFKRRMLERIGKRIHDSLRDDIRSPNFSQANLRNLAAFLRVLKERPRSLDKYIYNGLSEESRQVVDSFESIDKIQDHSVSKQIAEDLNRLICSELIYTPERFVEHPLADETQRLLESRPNGETLQMLNRYLLVDAYPDMISPKIKDTINRTLRTQFVQVAHDITAGLYEQIEQMRDQMDATIADLQSTTFSAEQELQRLDTLKSRLVELIGVISQCVYDRTLTLDELRQAINR